MCCLQVSTFSAKGMSVVQASFVDEKFAEIECGLECGSYQLVFISPETLLSNLRWRELLTSDVYKKKLVAVGIDEAHCVTKW